MGAELLRREGRVGTTACFAILHPAHSAVGNWATGTPVFQVPVFPGPGFSEGIALRDYKKFAYLLCPLRTGPFEAGVFG